MSASKAEIELWEVFDPDIAQYVRDGEIWADPSSGKLLTLCPFLRKTTDVKSVQNTPVIYTLTALTISNITHLTCGKWLQTNVK